MKKHPSELPQELLHEIVKSRIFKNYRYGEGRRLFDFFMEDPINCLKTTGIKKNSEEWHRILFLHFKAQL